MNYWELLRLAAPETILVLTVLMVLAVDLVALPGLEPRPRRVICGIIAGLGCVVAAAWMLVMPPMVDISAGFLVVDPLTRLLKVALLVLTLFTLAISVEHDFTPHIGEYMALVLLATIGMMFLVSAEDILMIFISLELTSLCLYVLSAFDKTRVQSAEAALKYFLFGGVSAAVTLFGLSLLYGLAGGTNLGQIAAAIASPQLDPLALLAIVLTIAGFAFKVAAAPFHLWAPDVYQGAPTPSAAFIASGSKVAGFFVLAKVMLLGLKGAEGSGGWQAYQPGWVPVLAVMAALSMVLGNLAALAQTSVRRLLAYSAVAHAGYMLLGVTAQHHEGLASLVYYVVTYALATLGAFGVVAVVQMQAGNDRLADFAGLGRRAPLAAFCMLVFMLSLAGIPPLAGFFGKFYLFSAALRGGGMGLLWLVVLAVATSAVSLYYYLQVLKQIYVVEASGSPGSSLKAPLFGQVVLALLAAGVVVLGCAPNLLLAPLGEAVRRAGL